MENVPRVADVLKLGLADEGHDLYEYRHLIQPARIEIVDFSHYGTPQARRRCIAGTVPFELIKAYGAKIKTKTLGDVIHGLVPANGIVVDPVWGAQLEDRLLTETQVEPALNDEELRMNREAKEFHPIYNNMAFPDPVDQPSRTVTATCTRVSRESIVIEAPSAPGRYRRLTVRERASLQGFPITYQFYARSFAEKAKMVGNAIPPTFTYLLALAAQQLPADKFKGFEDAAAKLELPPAAALVTPPDSEGRSYPEGRSFRAAVPGLRFKSGMRFELANSSTIAGIDWKVRFFFGSSKDIREIDLDGSIKQGFQEDLKGPQFSSFRANLKRAQSVLASSDPWNLQAVWTRRGEGLGPYQVVDLLGDLAGELKAVLERHGPDEAHLAAFVIQEAGQADGPSGKLPARSKLEKYALEIVSGFVVGDWFNTLEWHHERRVAA
jgi:DNA (cytosine-5)-methyltransferase 1